MTDDHQPDADGSFDPEAVEAWHREFLEDKHRTPRLVPGLAPAPISDEEYEWLLPEKTERWGGFLYGAEDDDFAREQREDVLALLLTNAGLEAAVRLAPREAWLEALSKVYGRP